ncbi:MAG TPA: sulfurtransferase TusA family protein [Ktedonobacterales bacterium]
MGLEPETSASALPQPGAVLDMTQVPAAQGAMCALLTPAIKAKLREMAGGQVLEIRVNDPTAREDIASWCRLSGHELLAGIEDSPQLLRMFVRKKQG